MQLLDMSSVQIERYSLALTHNTGATVSVVKRVSALDNPVQDVVIISNDLRSGEYITGITWAAAYASGLTTITLTPQLSAAITRNFEIAVIYKK